jgi:ABC-type branched-subunit amino acid transport system substrate-binding protein
MWLLVALLFSGSIALQANEDKAALVAIGLLTTPGHPETASLVQGATLAIEHAGIGRDPKFRLAVRGRPGQWGTEGDEAAALALDDQTAGIISPSDGSATHQILQVSGRTRVPVVSICPDSSVTSAGIPWVVRIAPGTQQQARTIFTGANLKTENPARWAALVPTGRDGREISNDLTESARQAAANLHPPYSLPENSADSQALLRKLAADPPDAILLWLDPVTAGQWTRDLRNAGFGGTLAGPCLLSSVAFLRQALDSAEGMLVPGIVPDPDSEARYSRFAAAHNAQFGSQPDFPALMAYDAALLLIELIRASEQQPLHQVFPLKQAFPGASGTLRFDKNGNRNVTLELLEVAGASFKALSTAGGRQLP